MKRPIPTRVDDAIYALHEQLQVHRGLSFDEAMQRLAEVLENAASNYRVTGHLPDEHDHGG